MISWVSERKAIFVDSFVPRGCCKSECTEWRMVCSVHNTVQGLENVEKWILLALTEKGLWESWDERQELVRGVTDTDDLCRCLKGLDITFFSTVQKSCFWRGAMRRNSVRFAHSLVRAHRESDWMVWESNRVMKLSAVIFTGGKF